MARCYKFHKVPIGTKYCPYCSSRIIPRWFPFLIIIIILLYDSATLREFLGINRDISYVVDPVYTQAAQTFQAEFIQTLVAQTLTSFTSATLPTFTSTTLPTVTVSIPTLKSYLLPTNTPIPPPTKPPKPTKTPKPKPINTPIPLPPTATTEPPWRCPPQPYWGALMEDPQGNRWDTTESISSLNSINWHDRSGLKIQVFGPFEVWVWNSPDYVDWPQGPFYDDGEYHNVGNDVSSIKVVKIGYCP